MTLNTTKLAITLLLFMFLGHSVRDVFSQPANETAEVTAVGVGVTAEAAQKNAIINAVQQVVGLYVDSETLVKNEKLVVDQVLAVSSGFVSSFEVKSPPHKRLIDELFETTIKAVVQKTRVAEQLNKVNIGIPVNAQDAWAEAFSRLQNAQDGRRLLEKYWPEVSLKLLRARLVDDNGQPIKGASRPAVKPDANTGLVWCAWNIEVSYDTDAYFKDVAPRLRRIFDAICVHKLEQPLTRKTPTSVDSEAVQRIAVIGAPIRWILDDKTLYTTHSSSWSSFPEKRQDQNEFNLTLIMTSDVAGFLQSAESYVLGVNPYAQILMDAIANNLLVVKFVGGNGLPILDTKLRFNDTYLESVKPKYGYGNWQPTKSRHHMPIAGEVVNLGNTSLLWDTQVGHDLSSMWLIAPEFRFWCNSYALTDRVLLRYETELHPDTLKDLKELQLSFAHQKP